MLLTRSEAIRELAEIEYSNMKGSDVIDMIEDLYKYTSNDQLKELWRKTHFQGNSKGILKLRKGENPQPPITIVLEGGVIQDISFIPVGTVIRVRDYDTDGSPIKHLAKDEDGNRCHESYWEMHGIPKD